MSGPNSIWVVPSEHIPGLVALVATPIVLWLAYCGLQALRAQHVTWAEKAGGHLDQMGGRAKVALIGLWVGFIVHVVIVPTHWGDARVTALLFILDAVLFAGAAVWTFLARPHWKLIAVAISAGTAATYALYLLIGQETADPVGLITTTVELAAALVLLVPSVAVTPGLRARDVWLTIGAIPVALVSLLGVAAIAGSSAGVASATSDTSSTSTAAATSSHGMAGMSMGSAGAASQATTASISLPTTSPSGSITWPDNMGAMDTGMKLMDPSCTTQPTAAQQQAAETLVDQTVSAVSSYRSLAAAKAAGYVPLTPTGQRQVHYINPSIFRSESSNPAPSAVPVLVYDNTKRGAVLVAAMYLMNARSQTPPQPGGCLTQWHVHTDLCLSGLKVVGTNESGPCANGSVNQITPPMMHVWLVPDGGGPLDPMPADAAVLSGARSLVPSPPNGIA